ncbi:response regulator [Caenispirillum bisanense]|uniref:response regulator n=1 Tax=Caenispirillum bisanense TaxID=414052 RepID=UPI0031D77269
MTTTTTTTPEPLLLVVDDDRDIRDLLGRFLVRHGFRVMLAADGADMRARMAEAAPDLIILDLMLPGEDGLSLCRGLRAAGDGTPIVMLTAMGEDVDRIVGLELGADDYLPKPFNPRELVARIKAVLRRAGDRPAEPQAATAEDAAGGVYRFAGYTLDPATRACTTPEGAPLELSAGEYDMLLAFLDHPRRVLSRDQLLDLARGRTAIPFDRSVDIQVSRLRRKIEPDPKTPTLIKTVRGGGYLFTPEVDRP